jgi:hypothetical protein
VLDPALVVTLGRFSLQTFMPGSRIGQAHGTVRPVDPETGAENALAFAMYHPAAAFRQGSLKETMQVDMCSIPEALVRARAARGPRAAELAGESPGAETTQETTSIQVSVVQELVGAVPEVLPDASEQGLWG